MVKDYLEKVYSGFLGMNVGIRLGAPVEPTIWTYQRILDTYGDIHDYVKEFKNFAADDDANGPVFFLRALLDDAVDRPLEPQDVARAWLNYAREGVGMFWWGGYGISTEHTAYLNLKNGIPAPQSGSIRQNGKTMAEQIGGQIFIDTWGLVNPGAPQRAADYGQTAASVSHDGNGVYGEGITNYIQDLSGLGYDFTPDPQDPAKVQTMPMWGWYGAARINILPQRLFISGGYSEAHIQQKHGYFSGDQYRNGQYIFGNIFYNFTSRCSIAAEYLYGSRENRDGMKNHANRVSMQVQYNF
mgnify:CR=1 FL=1